MIKTWKARMMRIMKMKNRRKMIKVIKTREKKEIMYKLIKSKELA
jgi:hypothetical protein